MIIFSDFHADSHTEFARPWKDGCNTRLKSQLDVLTRVFEIADEEQDDYILFLGDWFHRWRAVDTAVSAMVSRTLYALMDRYKNVRLVMLPGNHDMPNKNFPSVSTIAPYAAHPRIRVVEEPWHGTIDGRPFVVVPYYQDHAFVRDEAVRLAKVSSRRPWLLAHLDIVGAVASIDGYVSAGGVSLEDLDVFEGGVFGHYHMPQTFTSRGGYNFHYAGSPMQLSWVDEMAGEDAEKIRGVLRLNGNSVRRIPIDSPRFVKVPAGYTGELREKDYHLVECTADVADDVYREWEKKMSGSGAFRVMPTKQKEESKVIPSRMSTGEDAILAYVKARGHLCECDAATLIDYGKFYYGGNTNAAV